MEIERYLKEFVIIIIASIVIALAFVFPQKDTTLLLYVFISLFVIIIINTLAKIFFAYYLETNISLSFWSIYYWWFPAKDYFKKPLTMAWLPLLLSLITLGNIIWMPIIEFDVEPRPERISRRHGLYRFTEVTDWHIALIAAAGIFTTIFFGVIAYFANLELFARLSIFYAAWSIVPLGRLDGAKYFLAVEIFGLPFL